MICPICKTEIGEDKIFCPNCGNKIIKPEVEQPPEIPVEPLTIIPIPLKIDIEPEHQKNRKASGLFISLTILFGVVCIVLLGITISINKQSARYQSRIDQYISKNQELSTQVEQYETNVSDLNSQISQKDIQIEELENQAHQYQLLSSDYKLLIDDVFQNEILINAYSIYNGNDDGEKISDYLYSSSLQYLSVDYEILTPNGINDYIGSDLDIKVIKPDGTLLQGDSSPYNSSLTETIDGKYGHFGWGNSEGGSYSDGLYVIQFLYQGSVIGTEAVIIN